jgi:hypothetical protein
MNTKIFWLKTAERALKTFCQSMGSLLVAGNAIGILQVNLKQCLWVSSIAAGASVFTSISSSNFGEPNSPSLIK